MIYRNAGTMLCRMRELASERASAECEHGTADGDQQGVSAAR